MLNDEVRNIWNTNAAFWDQKMGEGNSFHKKLIEPIQLKLLNVQKGDRILDIACGNGQFARKLAGLGAIVTAIDFAENFIAVARSKSTGDIDYRVVDVTSETELKLLPGNRFDSIVCTMALMDMESIEPLMRHLPEMLKHTGAFVFSVLHPCFNSGESVLIHERDDSGGELKDRYCIKTRNYLAEQTYPGVGMAGQPKSQYYFHRPISILLKHLFQYGFVLDAYEEPAFDAVENPDSIFENVFSKIPPALICRARR